MRAWLICSGFMVAFAIGAAPHAQAERPPFWQRLMDANVRELEAALAHGDQLLAQVREPQAGVTLERRGGPLRRAYEHYQYVAKRWPDDPTAHLRLGGIIVNLMDICRPSCITADDRQLAYAALDHWQVFMTQRAGDPMVYDLLFDRAILHTKLGGANLSAAAADYRSLIRLGETGVYLGSPAVIRLNLAEVLMMQGQLDASIDEYRVAVSISRDTSAIYGLAVALDRLGYPEEARAMVRALGEEAFAEFRFALEQGSTFYVPEGEVYYYLGVVLEALGHPKQAHEAFSAFIASGANPQFAPQAAGHLQRLGPARAR